VGRRIQTDRIVARIAWAYLAIFAVVLLALGDAAFLFVARSDADAMRPILLMPEGRAAYRAALIHAGSEIALAEGLLLALVAAASYGLALVSTRPLRMAQMRERRFSADAAHELRTPLARIASVAQAAYGRSDLADDALRSIAANALEASTLIGDLLLLSRVEALPEAAREPVDVRALVAATVAKRLDPASTVAVTIDAAPDVFVLGDAALLTRLFGNVLENAGRYARSAIVVRIAAGNGRGTVAVSDDGPGVPEAFRERLFERFSRGPESTGSGLGLSLALWIARAHGGDLRWLGGSRFEVTLPLALPGA
jgi:signal transduction histidine kinase